MDDGALLGIFDGYDVVLCDTVRAADALNRRVASLREGGAFGTVATSFSSWLRGAWALAGDGRAFAEPMAEMLVMEAVLRRMELRHVQASPHLASAAAQCVRRGAGVAAFDRAVARAGAEAGIGGAAAGAPGEGAAAGDVAAAIAMGMVQREDGAGGCGAGAAGDADGSGAGVGRFASGFSMPEGLGEAERELLGVFAEYLRVLASGAAGLVEPGHAMAMLAGAPERSFARPLSVCIVGDAPRTPAEQEFWQRLDGHVSCTQLRCDGTPWPQDGTPELAALLSPELTRPPEGVCVRFAFPAGRYAQAPLVADIVSELLGGCVPDSGACTSDGETGSGVASETDVGAVSETDAGAASETGAGAVSEADGETASETGVCAGICDGAPVVAGQPPRKQVIVTSADPLAFYDGLARTLAAKGISCAVAGDKPFGETAFGRAYIELAECIATGSLPWDKTRLADVLYSPVLGIDHARVSDLDARFRSDRLLAREDAFAELEQAFPRFACLLALVQHPDAAAFTRFSAQMEELPHVDELFLEEQKAALSLVWAAWSVSEALGGEDGTAKEGGPAKEGRVVSTENGEGAAPAAPAPALATSTPAPELFLSANMLAELLRTALPVRYANYPPGSRPAPQVLVESLEDAATEGPGACDALVVCDLDSESYPATSRDDASRLLLDKLGVPRGEERLQRQRRTWRELVAVPARDLIVGRVLNDVDGEPTYPCPMLEEFTDLYRKDTRTADDLHRVFSIPPVLQAGVNVPQGATPLFSRGEDGFTDNVAYGLAPAGFRDAPQQPLEGEALEHMLRRLRLPPRSEWEGDEPPEVSPDAPLRLSPSQIEAYLECPYKWFATRWAAIGAPDEGFGALEKGSFVHEALRRFFGGCEGKVGSEGKPLEAAVSRAQLVAGELLAEQPGAPQTQGRLAPLPNSSIEQSQALELCDDVVGVVAHEPLFLQKTGFVPAAFEFSFSDLDVRWGGCRLGGTIDRIDVDDGGNAVIVDYKGTVLPAHDLPKAKAYPKSGLAGRKVQALLYMAALSASPDLREAVSKACGRRVERIVGALYLSYKRDPAKVRVRGALACEVDELCTSELDIADAAAVACAASRAGRENLAAQLALPTASSSMPCYPLTSSPDGGPTLAQVLSDLEETVRTQVVARIEAGCVAAEPSGKDACKFCPVAACERRLS